MALTQVAPGLLDTTAQYYSFKNRIINGAMVIDQRNAGASVTPTGGQYLTDRFRASLSQAAKYTVQQNAGSVTPPTGYTNYLGATSLSAYAVTSADFFSLSQFIEGYNIADLAWGTANAKTVTLSFWVRSSLTGTFGGALTNGGNSRSYPFTYTISSANTWEYKTITIAGDTTGTWDTTNSIGIKVNWSLGVGTTLSGTAGAWAGTSYLSATGATSVVGTNGATFYITGVQLEKGSTATSFDYRPYGTELALCQRYYQVIRTLASGGARTSTNIEAGIQYLCEMRAVPSAGLSAAYAAYNLFGNAFTQSSANIQIGVVGNATTNGAIIGLGNFTGLTQGQVMWAANGGYILLSAEL